MSKRKRPDSKTSSTSLTEHEKKLYDAIRVKQEMGANRKELKGATGLLDSIVTRTLKSLVTKALVKEVPNMQKRGLKHYMAVEFEPSKEITGGAWYVDGNLDMDFIKSLKSICVKLISSRKIATLDTLYEVISEVTKVSLTKKQVEEILDALVFDNEIMKVKSNKMGEFAAIPAGKDCYKLAKKQSVEAKTGALASIPCGACPQISHCTPDGVISPKTCVYYQKWLEF